MGEPEAPSASTSMSAGIVPAEHEILVAVDCGSNSFHMIIARHVGGHIHVIDRMRERVLLAAGLGADKSLTKEAEARGLACLQRFGQRLRSIPQARVRAVGTNTLRKAKNAREFLARARDALGHPIEVISGTEEARIIYLGVAHDLSDDQGRRLVIDIGGGSTELIVGERFEARRTDSLHMGCVSHTLRFFPDGRLRQGAFREAVTEAQVEFEPIKRDFRRLGWVSAVGSSGTITSIDGILRANGWGDGITYPGLQKLRDVVIEQGRIDRLQIPELSEERASVLPGGLRAVRADPGKLEQAVRNLLSNAYKYSPDGGEVAVTLAVEHGQAVVAVRDHGIGMTPEAVRRVCDRFFRADTSGNIPGTGLGMAIVKEIVDLLGGRLAVESAPQQGTTVRIVLPLAVEPVPIAELAEPAPL